MTSTRRAGTRRRSFAATGIGAVLLIAATGCSMQDLPHQLSVPDPATDQGKRIFDLWQGTWVTLWIIGGFTWLLIIGSAVFYRRRHAEHIPKQTKYNLPIEILYTITPLVIIAVFYVFTYRDTDIVTKVTDDAAVNVNVVGYQWNWTFNYIDDQVYTTGTPADLPTLYLPVGEKVRFILTSPDVIHSFWVPAFLMKMDVVPGRTNQFEVTPTTLGHFAGRCAELCGTSHSEMVFWVDVVTPEQYAAKIAEFKAAGQTGALTTGRANNDAQNQGNTRFGGQF